MVWEVEYTDECEEWWKDLDEGERKSVQAVVERLAERRPALRFPDSSGVVSSRHERMRELRVQHGGEPYRVFYAFNPLRAAVLLIGGTKTGDDRFYKRMVPIADRLYDVHLAELEQERRSHGEEF